MLRGICSPIVIHRFRGMRVAIGVDMKMNRIMAMISIMMLIMISCGEKEKIVEVAVPVNCVPSTPRGVYAINFNGTVQICWVANYETDLAGYSVYRSSNGEQFDFLGNVIADNPSATEYCYEDLETDNGIQYYYAVSAYDNGGLESEIIIEEVVSGTPRPEGLQLSLYDAADLPYQSGFDFYPGLSNTVQLYTLETTDLFFGVVGGVSMLIARRIGVEIQDYGYASNIDAVNYAPSAGWSASRTAEAIAKHMYILRLLEDDGYHYAKVYVTAVAGSVTLDWAFQTDPGNPDLAPPPPGRGAGALSSSYPKDANPGLNTEAKLTNRFSDPPIVERVTWTRDSRSGHQTTE
jgi:hypothetical protein